MFTQASILSSLFKLAATAVFLVLYAAGQLSNANAIEGFYAGGAIGREYADVDYKKSIGLNLTSTPAVSTHATDNAQGGMSSFKAILGHRWNLPGRTYFSGEVDAALRLNNSVTGFLEGARHNQNPDADVFPGDWYLDKNHSVGIGAKLGYLPERIRFWSKGGSVYVIAGIQRLDVTVETAAAGMLSDGTEIMGKRRENLSVIPWLAGGGIEIGSDRRRLDLRAIYTRYDFDYGAGDALTITTPRVDYRFKVSGWGVYLGYTWSFRLGPGN